MPTVPGQRFAGKHLNLPVSPSSDNELVPTTISDHPEKLELWNFLLGDLKQRGLWSPTYLFLLQETVEAAWDCIHSRKLLQEEGRILDKVRVLKDGTVVTVGKETHPAYDQLSKDRAFLLKCIEKLGMSPRDIVFLLQTDPSTEEVLHAEVEVKEKVVYFR